jgi:hypothetical protein
MAIEIKHIAINDRNKVRALFVESWDTLFPGISLIDNSLVKGEDIVCDIVGSSKDSHNLIFGLIVTKVRNASLMNLINTFNWIDENRYLLNRAYVTSSSPSTSPLDFMVIGDDFSDNFLTSLTSLDLPPISLYKFLCMEVNNEQGIIVEEIRYQGIKTTRLNREEQRKSFNVCLECLGLTHEEEKDLLSPLD